MTQPSEAVGGGSNDTIIAAEPTIEDRLNAAMTDQVEEKPEEEQAAAEAPLAEEQPELTAEDVAEEEAEPVELPPIDPPVSWTGENKAKFAELPRDVQEYVSQRETEREKFVQTKAQEAAKTRSEVERQAVEAMTNLQNNYAQSIQAMLPQIPAKPSAILNAEDPWAYAEQLDAHERAVAQHNHVQQQLTQIAQQQAQVQQATRQQLMAETEAALKTDFPEYLDPAKGPELRQKLASTGLELGFSAEQLADVDHRDIKAMRTATEWRDKAAKYDSLMAQKMATVRAAKDMPKVTKPGASRAPGAVANERYTADREAMRNGDQAATARVFGRFLK